MSKFNAYCESILKQLSQSEQRRVLDNAKNEEEFTDAEVKIFQNFIVKPSLLKPGGFAHYKNVKISTGTFEELDITKVTEGNVSFYEANAGNDTHGKASDATPPFGARSSTFRAEEDTGVLLSFLNKVFER